MLLMQWISRQAFLDECAILFPDLLPWAFWCYGVHPVLWHPMESNRVTHWVLYFLLLSFTAIDEDDECLDLLYQAWYMDDGVLAGKRSAVLRALSLIKTEIFVHKAGPLRFPTSS